MTAKLRKGDYAVLRTVESMHSLTTGRSEHVVYKIVRVVKADREGQATHLDRPCMFDGARANGGNAKPVGSAVFTIGPHARNPRLAELDGLDYSGERAIKDAILGLSA